MAAQVYRSVLTYVVDDDEQRPNEWAWSQVIDARLAILVGQEHGPVSLADLTEHERHDAETILRDRQAAEAELSRA